MCRCYVTVFCGCRTHVVVPLYCFVIVSLPQTTEDDLRSARAVRGRRMSQSQLVNVCSWSWLWWVGRGRDVGGGWYACRTKPGGWSHVGRRWSISRVQGDTLMTPDHATFRVRSSG